jgi:hypothetical protein
MNQVIEIDWNEVMLRLTAQRQRLELSKEEVKTYIKAKYGYGFWRMTDNELMELGMTMKGCQTKDDFLSLIPVK